MSAPEPLGPSPALSAPPSFDASNAPPLDVTREALHRLATPPPDSLPGDLEATVARVAAQRGAWVEVPLARRAELLAACAAGVELVAERWVEVAAACKGLPLDDPRAGGEWLSGPLPVMQNLRLLEAACRAGGKPKPKKTRTAHGRTIARVFPTSLAYRILLGGTTADVWMAPGKSASQGSAVFGAEAGKGRLAVVLGASNISAIPLMDSLTKLFAEGQVVVLKMNPINAALGPLFETAFRVLVDAGYFAIVYGGAAVGAALTSHPLVDTLHVTGSDATYDAIVWGTGEGQARRKAEGARQNQRPFTAELGSVTPVLVTPGPYSRADLVYQARHVASMLTHNGGFNCDAAQVVVLARDWLQKRAFLELLREELDAIAPQPTFIPGAAARHAELRAAHPACEVRGAAHAKEGTLPWLLVPGLRESSDDGLLTKEAFCGALAVVELDDAASPPVFLDRAVRFANERLWGTLSVTLLVHPSTLEEHEAAVEQALAELKFGAVCLNAWAGVTFALAAATWGAYPGHTPADIQSGSGVVHNALLFDHPEKTVLRAPFRSSPPPPYFSRLLGLRDLGRALVAFESAPSFGRTVSVIRAALAVKTAKLVPTPTTAAAAARSS